METVFRICLLLTSLVNLLPAALAFAPGRIGGSYGITVPSASHELLLRHRALLFLLVGGLLLYAAVTRRYYGLAVLFGVFSMASFVALYLLVGPGISPELRKVMLIDVAALAVLLLGYALYSFYPQGR